MPASGHQSSPCLQDPKTTEPTWHHDNQQRPAKAVLPEELPGKPLQGVVAETEPWGELQHSPAAEPESPESPELDGATAAVAVPEAMTTSPTQQLPLQGSVTTQVSCVAPIQVLCPDLTRQPPMDNLTVCGQSQACHTAWPQIICYPVGST